MSPRGLALPVCMTILTGMTLESPQPPIAAASSSLSCETCGKSDMLEVARTRLAQHVTCRECGAEHVLALRQQWTLIHPSGTVLSFDSMTALRRALDDGDDSDDDAINLVSISEPPRIAPIPPVPDASSPLPPPPPPPHRTSAVPRTPAPESEDANATSATIGLPTPSPLPPTSEPLLPSVMVSETDDDAPSEPSVEPLTVTSSSSALTETVKGPRWTDQDEEALALPPPPRRGGWVVAAGSLVEVGVVEVPGANMK